MYWFADWVIDSLVVCLKLKQLSLVIGYCIEHTVTCSKCKILRALYSPIREGAGVSTGGDGSEVDIPRPCSPLVMSWDMLREAEGRNLLGIFEAEREGVGRISLEMLTLVVTASTIMRLFGGWGVCACPRKTRPSVHPFSSRFHGYVLHESKSKRLASVGVQKQKG